MSEPTFTVALKAYNEQDCIADAIRSVLAQTRDDFELVVVDDGSTDATAEVVRGFQSDPRVQLVRQENRGVAAAVNAAIDAGGAPYISLIDADDLWLPDYLEQMGRTLDSDPAAGFAYTDGWIMERPSGRFQRLTSNQGMGEPQPPPHDPEEFLRLLIEANFVFGLATIRRSALQQVGGAFNESLRAAEEYEVWIRMLAAGFGAARAPGPLVVVCEREDGLHGDERAMVTNAREVCRIAAEDLDTSAEVRGRARRRMAELDRLLVSLDGGAWPAAKRGLRRRLGSIRRATLGRRSWYRDGAPPEVAAAFPDLA